MLDDKSYVPEFKLRDRYKTVSRLNTENENEKLKYDILHIPYSKPQIVEVDKIQHAKFTDEKKFSDVELSK